MAEYKVIIKTVPTMVTVDREEVVGVTLTLTAEEAYRVNNLCCKD